jgi:hypothetical protein
MRDENTCVLSPYTGEWTDGSKDDQCNNTNVEFYRRHRVVGRSASAFLDDSIAILIELKGSKCFALKHPFSVWFWQWG